MAHTLIQQAFAVHESGGPSTLEVNLPAPPTQYNTLLVVTAKLFNFSQNSGSYSISGSGGSFVFMGSRAYAAGNMRVEVRRVYVNTDTVGQQITVNLSATNPLVMVAVFEYTDLPSMSIQDDTTTGVGSSNVAFPNPATTTSDNDLGLLLTLNRFGSTSQIGSTESFSEVFQETTDPVGGSSDINLGVFSRNITPPQTLQPQVTLTESRQWVSFLLTLFESAEVQQTKEVPLDVSITDGPFDIGAFLDVSAAANYERTADFDVTVKGDEFRQSSLQVFLLTDDSVTQRYGFLDVLTGAGDLLVKTHVGSFMDMWIDTSQFPQPDLTSSPGDLRAGMSVAVEGQVWRPLPEFEDYPLLNVVQSGLDLAIEGTQHIDGHFDYTNLLDLYIQGTAFRTASLQIFKAFEFARGAFLNVHVGTIATPNSSVPGPVPQTLSSRMDVAVLQTVALSNVNTTPEDGRYIDCRPLWKKVPQQVKMPPLFMDMIVDVVLTRYAYMQVTVGEGEERIVSMDVNIVTV